jgi:hypothetical protein
VLFLLWFCTGDVWWEVLPIELKGTWRRKASSSSSSYIFTPSTKDLKWPEYLDADAAAPILPEEFNCWDEAAGGLPEAATASGSAAQDQALRCCWARVLVWARWRLGEPVIVRETEVSGWWCWLMLLTRPVAFMMLQAAALCALAMCVSTS